MSTSNLPHLKRTARSVEDLDGALEEYRQTLLDWRFTGKGKIERDECRRRIDVLLDMRLEASA